MKLSEAFSLTIDAGALLGGDRDEHQNDNDARPAQNGAFVYSEGRYGFWVASGASYYINKFYFGIEAQLAGIYVDHGWDRFAADEKVDSEFEYIPSIGPKIGYTLAERFDLEASVQIGESIGFGLAFIMRY